MGFFIFHANTYGGSKSKRVVENLTNDLNSKKKKKVINLITYAIKIKEKNKTNIEPTCSENVFKEIKECTIDENADDDFDFVANNNANKVTAIIGKVMVDNDSQGNIIQFGLNLLSKNRAKKDIQPTHSSDWHSGYRKVLTKNINWEKLINKIKEQCSEIIAGDEGTTKIARKKYTQKK
ncbi:hypothetical protein BJ944DRAFT_232675 [Cunninghamella echinulata]|nr:hypothetical protein BJ944DRAFT_232675 [Cunninghamella echinulata]